MLHSVSRFIRQIAGKFFSRRRGGEVDPAEIFLDSHNLPQFDTHQLEGRLDSPISRLTIYAVGSVFFAIIAGYLFRAGNLGIVQGAEFRERSENNRLNHTPVFAARGVIFDRNGVELAWNGPAVGEGIEMGQASSTEREVTIRNYIKLPGLGHTLGYVQYPTKDKFGFYYREDFLGVAGVEKFFNDRLQGKNGVRLIETNALGKVESENVIKPPKEGENITLSIDSRVQSQMYQVIKSTSEKVGFSGGAGIIMDVHTGEVIAMTSYPEYDPKIMSDGDDATTIKQYLNDKRTPFLNRVIDGLYTPGSIVKPFMAIAALNEKVIDPSTKILSTGSISVPNQYDPKLKTVFRDWKAHGWVDMRRALAVSSDVYFYAVGGGYEKQKGLGILRIDDYIQRFGFGKKIDAPFFDSGAKGTIPTPEWKAATFDGDIWRVGDTYLTSIGQYGFQVSVAQAARAVAVLANRGSLINPTLVKDEVGKVESQLTIPDSYYDIVIEGMRQSTTDGTSVALNVPYVEIAAKSGTAELGVSKETVNSWITGFFPQKTPRYAFAVVLEKGSRHNLVGAAAAMRELIDWMNVNTPEYFK